MNRLIYFPVAMLLAVSSNAASLPVVEAESGTLGGEFTVSTLDGADNITISTMPTANNPGSAARVASYAMQFPSADTYQLYARVRVGAGSYNDDSFFYGNGFGAKSPTTDTDWVGRQWGEHDGLHGSHRCGDGRRWDGGNPGVEMDEVQHALHGSQWQPHTNLPGRRARGRLLHGQVCFRAVQPESNRGGA